MNSSSSEMPCSARSARRLYCTPAAYRSRRACLPVSHRVPSVPPASGWKGCRTQPASRSTVYGLKACEGGDHRGVGLFLRGFLRAPVSWFVESLAFKRQNVGSTVPAFVVSDGERTDLADLVGAPAVELVQTGSAIGDLLALSGVRVLLASGGSSFSAWAAYLGEMPAIARPGQSLTSGWSVRRRVHSQTGSLRGASRESSDSPASYYSYAGPASRCGVLDTVFLARAL
jgi:hypothetical protein